MNAYLENPNNLNETQKKIMHEGKLGVITRQLPNSDKSIIEPPHWFTSITRFWPHYASNEASSPDKVVSLSTDPNLTP